MCRLISWVGGSAHLFVRSHVQAEQLGGGKGPPFTEHCHVQAEQPVGKTSRSMEDRRDKCRQQMDRLCFRIKDNRQRNDIAYYLGNSFKSAKAKCAAAKRAKGTR